MLCEEEVGTYLIITKTKVINFMTKIGLRLGMLVNTAPGAVSQIAS